MRLLNIQTNQKNQFSLIFFGLAVIGFAGLLLTLWFSCRLSVLLIGNEVLGILSNVTTREVQALEKHRITSASLSFKTLEGKEVNTLIEIWDSVLSEGPVLIKYLPSDPKTYLMKKSGDSYGKPFVKLLSQYFTMLILLAAMTIGGIFAGRKEFRLGIGAESTNKLE